MFAATAKLAVAGLLAFSAFMLSSMGGSASAGEDEPSIRVEALAEDFSSPRMIVSGTSGDEAVSVTNDADDWLIESPNGITSSGCEVDSVTRVRCPTHSDSLYYRGNFLVVMEDGDDGVELSGDLLEGSIFGASGNDLLVGNGQHNFLSGNQGNDIIKGAGGPDNITGSDGHDALMGQRGNDHVHALDGIRDRRISCGPGKHDFADVDRNLDPRPTGCEKVAHRDFPQRRAAG